MAIGVSGSGSNLLTATAFPQYSGSPVNYIPQVYSGKLLVKFYLSTVFGEISNTDYQGEISSMGDKVIIRVTPDVVIADYTKGALLAVQAPVANSTELVIDKAKYFNVTVDDIDAFQSDLNMIDTFTDDAAHQLKIAIDASILAVAALGAPARAQYDGYVEGGAAGTPATSSTFGVTTSARVVAIADVLDFIVDAGTYLDEKNVPEDGRWMVLPAWVIGRIKKSDLKDASLAGDGTSILRNGRIGMIDRFTIYLSNQLPAGVAGGLDAGEYAAYFGQKHGLSFASQLTKNETVKSERTFGHLVRGLQVFGWKVLKPGAVGFCVIKKA